MQVCILYKRDFNFSYSKRNECQKIFLNSIFQSKAETFKGLNIIAKKNFNLRRKSFMLEPAEWSIIFNLVFLMNIENKQLLNKI